MQSVKSTLVSCVDANKFNFNKLRGKLDIVVIPGGVTKSSNPEGKVGKTVILTDFDKSKISK
jgi:hypothetical protein